MELLIVMNQLYILGNQLYSAQLSNNYNNKQDLLSYGIKGQLSSIYIRPIAYKIFLNIFPIEKSLTQWISITFNNRFNYLQLKSKYFQTPTNTKNITKISSNSFTKNNLKNNSIINNCNKDENKENDEELKNLIKLDLTRTFQEISLFKEEKNMKILFEILYIYCKQHLGANIYKQGMNEIISILFLAIYPYYFTINKYISRIDIINAINSYNKRSKSVLYKNRENESGNKNKKNIFIKPANNKKELDILFYFFHDEKYLEVDLYYLFNDIMEKGFNTFFKDDSFQKRCDDIINNKLKIIDFKLYQHVYDIKVAYNIFFGKWIQTFFDRVIKLADCIAIFDILISKEVLNNDINSDIYYIKENDIFEMDFLDCLCLSLLKKYRKDLLQKNSEEFLIFCLCYPEIQNLNEIIQSANFINLTLKNSKSDINKINENLDEKSTEKITQKKMINNVKKIKTKLNIKTYLSFTESNSNFYNSKKLLKNNTINGNCDANKNTNKNISSKSNSFLNSDKSNKSTKLLDTNKNNIKENTSKFSIFDKLSSFSHQFDEYKINDLIDTYYF